ncbi:MAG: hypothetical protein ACHQFW_00075 [Chitinophagales bacterium]
MTFYNPSNKGPIIGIAVLLFLGIFGSIFFFTFKECGSSGIFRSGKTSDATELYQVFPAESNGKIYLISLEGVFKTRIYSRQGGITQRSGSTDIRLTSHDLETGEQTMREVLGDYHDAYTKILGVGKNVIWLYNKKNGLHSRKIEDFKILTTNEKILEANKDLSEGLALAQDYLGNLDELYAYNNYADALMVTTISGRKIWISGTNFNTVEPPVINEKRNDLDNIIDEIIDKAMNGATPEMEILYDEIIQTASDLSSFSDIGHTSTRVTGADSCDYSFEGETVKSIIKSNCKQPQKVNPLKEKSGVFIQPVFLSEYNTEQQKYINPVFLGDDRCIIFHSKSVGVNSDLMVSLVNLKTLQPEFTTKTGIILSNYRASYEINGSYGNSDSLFVAVDNQLFCFNLKSGKLIWKNVIGKDDYYSQIYYLGTAFENGKRYFIAASSYFTELSRDGIFVNGRTDYQVITIDGANGKTVKKLDATDSKPEKLPYYLGMAGGKSWFYSKANGVHARTVADLKITENSFLETIKNAGIESQLVTTSKYDDAIEEKYIGMDAKNSLVYFTTENGLHYTYNLDDKRVSEVTAPSDKDYERWMSDNPHVEFYRVHHQNMFHHDLLLPGGKELYFEESNSIAKLMVKENKKINTNSAEPLKTNQFIEAEFLTNGISLNNKFNFNDNRNSPLSLNPTEKTFYIFHKNKIAPDAHQIISKFNYENETVAWAFDITNALGIGAEIVRIYTLNDRLYFIFKTHPDLDDNFVCVAISANDGKVIWDAKF